MAGIYHADIFCDKCIKAIKWDIALDLWRARINVILPDGTNLMDHDDIINQYRLDNYLQDMDECDYDSNEYPKYCPDSEEFDVPQYCSNCHKFLENDLTSDGYDYVKETIESELVSGCINDPSEHEWSCYDVDIEVKDCVKCGDWFYPYDMTEDSLCSWCADDWNEQD